MSPQARGLAHSVQVRLKNEARRTGRPAAELLELFAVERLLHRLGSSPHRSQFILKGALLLRHWLGEQTRPTRDIDLLGPGGLAEGPLREILREIQVLPVEPDGIEFDLASTVIRPIRIGSAVLGLRAKFDARLGHARLRYQVDIGLGDAVFPATVDVVPGHLLGMPVASVRAYTPYTTVAEKLEATVVHGNANSHQGLLRPPAVAPGPRLRRRDARRVHPPVVRAPRHAHTGRASRGPGRRVCGRSVAREALASVP